MTKLTKAEALRLLDTEQAMRIALESECVALRAQCALHTVPSAKDTMAEVHAHLHGQEDCSKCGGTGKYSADDGYEGDCYACRGKGYITKSDKRRNATYQYHQELGALIESHALSGYLSPRQIPLEEKRGKQIVQHDHYWYAIP